MPNAASLLLRGYIPLVRPAVIADHLSKTYVSNIRSPGFAGAFKTLFKPEKKRVEAVIGVNFTINEGELVGFLGPNGAGKTTTLKMLTGILYSTSGRGEVLGFDPKDRKPEMQRQISLVMGNKMQLWWDLPAWDSFVVLKEIYQVPDADFKKRIDELISLLELTDKINVQVRKLSLGERMKCELAAALLHNPRVVFLDEPTIGLDLVSQKRIREFLKKHNRENNTTILLTSHYMQDVVELCERVIIIDHGKLIFDGLLSDLSADYSQSRRIRFSFREPIEMDFSKFGKVVESLPQMVLLEAERNQIPSIASSILREFDVDDFSTEDTEIEDVVRDLFLRSAEKEKSNN